jgi:hypothetical protein
MCDAKGCDKPSKYQQNEYTKLCMSCWYETSKSMFEIWHDWFMSEKNTQEPPIWVYHSEKII